MLGFEKLLTRKSADLGDGPLTLSVDDLTVSLAIEETGGVAFTIDRTGKGYEEGSLAE